MDMQEAGNKYCIYNISLDVPVNHENPELLWNISAEKIQTILKDTYYEKYYVPSLIYYNLQNEAINQIFVNLAGQSNPSYIIKDDRLYIKICMPVLLLYDVTNRKRIAFAVFEIIDSKIQDKPTIVWF